jgi:hypothetical protein
MLLHLRQGRIDGLEKSGIHALFFKEACRIGVGKKNLQLKAEAFGEKLRKFIR